MKKLVFLAAATLAAATAAAQENPCKADIQKLCQGKSGLEMMKCMKDHAGDVSDSCKAKVATVKADAAEVGAACKDDAAKFCKGVKPGLGAIGECLKSNSAKLSPACKSTLQQKKEKVMSVNPCLSDASKLCNDIPPGKNRLMTCLKAHKSDLSPECKAKGLEALKKIDAARQGCKADTEKFCKDVAAAKGNVAECLKTHESELSDSCKKSSK